MQRVYPTIVIQWPVAPPAAVSDALAALLAELVNLGWSEEPRNDEDGAEWRIYFDNGADASTGLTAVRRFLSERRLQATVGVEHVADRDWMEAFREFFHATRVPPCWWIAPPWEAGAVAPGRGEHLLVIHPGLAFGTGLHETTRLCLEFIGGYPDKLTRVLDVGAGSGVLSIACARLGATQVEAFEIDAMAADNLRHNLALNGVEDVVRVHEADFAAISAAPASVVVCNMERVHFAPLLPSLCAALAPGGVLFATGFIQQGQQEVERLFAGAGLHADGPRRNGEWIGYLLRHRE